MSNNAICFVFYIYTAWVLATRVVRIQTNCLEIQCEGRQLLQLYMLIINPEASKTAEIARPSSVETKDEEGIIYFTLFFTLLTLSLHSFS